MTNEHSPKRRDLTDPPTPPVAAADKPASNAPGEPFKGEVSRTDSPGAGVSAAREANPAQERAPTEATTSTGKSAIDQPVATKPDSNDHKGAVEGDRADDTQHSNRSANRHAATLTRDGGPPAGSTAVAHDRIGANADDPEVSNAGETGRTNDTPPDEQGPRE